MHRASSQGHKPGIARAASATSQDGQEGLQVTASWWHFLVLVGTPEGHMLKAITFYAYGGTLTLIYMCAFLYVDQASIKS